MIEELQQRASDLGLTLKITNDGEHWTYKSEKFIAEWWPSTGRIVVNKRWHEAAFARGAERAFSRILKKYGFTDQQSPAYETRLRELIDES